MTPDTVTNRIIFHFSVFLAPIQDMPRFGRTPVYVWGMLLFAIFQFPVIYVSQRAAVCQTTSTLN